MHCWWIFHFETGYEYIFVYFRSMPRSKTGRKKKAVNAIGLKAAVHDVLTNNISLRDAARLPSISKSTLARHIKLHS
jgi:transposase-like protein